MRRKLVQSWLVIPANRSSPSAVSQVQPERDLAGMELGCRCGEIRLKEHEGLELMPFRISPAVQAIATSGSHSTTRQTVLAACTVLHPAGDPCCYSAL